MKVTEYISEFMKSDEFTLTLNGLKYCFITLKFDVIEEIIRRHGAIFSTPMIKLCHPVLEKYPRELKTKIIEHNEKQDLENVEYSLYDLVNNYNFSISDFVQNEFIIEMTKNFTCHDVYMLEIVSRITSNFIVICPNDPQMAESIVKKYQSGVDGMIIQFVDYCSYKLFKYICKIHETRISVDKPKKPQGYDLMKKRVLSRSMMTCDHQETMELYNLWLNNNKTYYWMRNLFINLIKFDVYVCTNECLRFYFPDLFPPIDVNIFSIFDDIIEASDNYQSCLIVYSNYKSGYLNEENVMALLPEQISEWVV